MARAASAAVGAAGRHGRAIYGPLRALGGPAPPPVGGKSPAADRRWAAAPTQNKQPNKPSIKQTALRPRRLPALLRLAAPALVRERPSGSARGRTQARTRTDTRIHTPADARTHAHKHTHANTHTDTRAHAHAHSHTHIYTRPHLTHADTYAHTHTTRTRRCRRYTPTPCRTARAGCSRHARTHARTHARMHACGWTTRARCEFTRASAARCTACGCNGRTRVPPTRARRVCTLRRRTAFHAAYGRLGLTLADICARSSARSRLHLHLPLPSSAPSVAAHPCSQLRQGWHRSPLQPVHGATWHAACGLWYCARGTLCCTR